jgi:hypothetical protein
LKPTKQQSTSGLSNHSWFYFASIGFSLLIFVGRAVLFPGALKGSIGNFCFDVAFLFSLLNIYVIRYREQRGLSTLPGRDFRRILSKPDMPIPSHYQFGSDGEIVEIPEKPKTNPP